MKRIAGIFILLSLVAGSLVFADDGLVLPQGVVRIRAIPSYTMLDQAYDNDGKAQDSAKGSVTTVSGAAELGVIAPVTFGIQWAPGYNVANSFTRLPAALAGSSISADKISALGAADIQVGAKIQLLGANGFAQNDKLRIALTPGVQIPLDNYDATTEADNAINGKTFRPASTSSHQSYGFGAKADVDYQINDMFFINAHGEAKYFLPNDSLDIGTVLGHDMTYAAYYQAYFLASDPTAAADAAAQADAAYPLTNTKSEYGINSFFEIEPHAKYAVSDALSFSAGLPFSYTMDLGTKSTYNGTSTTSDPESLLTVGPNVSCFALLGPLPVEMELQYVMPLMGKNSSANSTLSLQIKAYAKAF